MNAANDSANSYVLDASTLVELVVPGRHHSGALQFIDQYRDERLTLITAPHGLLEATNAVRALARANYIDDQRATLAIEHLQMLDLGDCSAKILLPRVWELRHNVSAYDAGYVASAELYMVPLVTVDSKLRAACRNRDVRVMGLPCCDAGDCRRRGPHHRN